MRLRYWRCRAASAGGFFARHPGSIVRIISGHWYGWQTTPDNGEAPHFAPIRICSARLDSRDGTLVELTFLTPGHPHGVKHSVEQLRILYLAHEHLIANLGSTSE